jgi:DNA mismatch endonuclease (patch repair protein)
MMSAVRHENTGPEKLVRSRLFAAGYRFRLHRRDLPGSPDIVLPRYRLAVFVHGCFWHGHDCPRGRPPKSNVEFWANKIERNQTRDTASVSALTALGWTVRIVWACRVIADTDDMVEFLRKRSAEDPAPAPHDRSPM